MVETTPAPLWMVFAPRRHGLPPLCNQGFIARPPELPTHDPERTLPCGKLIETCIQLSVVTANVRSMESGRSTGKLAYLQQQFSELNVNVVGIQESRSQSAFTRKSGDYIRLAAASDNGHFGVELWLAHNIPFATTGNGKQLFIRDNQLVVLHSDPRRLIVRIQTDWLEILSAVLHAPQSGIALESKQQGGIQPASSSNTWQANWM